MSDQSSSPPPGPPPSGKQNQSRPIIAQRLSAGNGATHPHFSQPVRQIFMMLVLLGLVLAGAWFAYGRILPVFLANPYLNGLIVAVFILGVVACFWQVSQLVMSVSWIERFAKRRQNAVERGIAASHAGDGDEAPRLLAPLAALLGKRGPVGGFISAGSGRSILESVASRIEELRDITKYLANLLIFLGLLGTFYGLATTVPAVIETIRALAPQEGESATVMFSKLMDGLEAQLGGMSTAFSSSLLGLAGSLVVGLLELFVTHGQNRFYRELEEWMSGFTRINLATTDEEGGDTAAYGGLLEQVAAQMDLMQRYHAERDIIREDAGAMADDRVLAVTEAVASLTANAQSSGAALAGQSAALTAAMQQLAQGQERLIALAQGQSPATPGLDSERLEKIIDSLSRDLKDGRDEMVAELRLDLLVLTRAIRANRFGDPFRDDLLPDPQQIIRREE